MKRDLDQMLGALSAAPAEHGLDGLEDQVFARIDAEKREAGGGVTLQVAAALLALVIGVVVGEVRDRRAEARLAQGPAATEMVVLSEGASLTPSVRLGGGA